MLKRGCKLKNGNSVLKPNSFVLAPLIIVHTSIKLLVKVRYSTLGFRQPKLLKAIRLHALLSVL
jgi:hypothetical protein